MCIIIAKDKKSRLPKEEELRNAFNYNNDGAGFMYVDNGKVIIDKGYMKYDAFLKRYKSLLEKYNNFKNKSLVIHCRIGTSGKNTKGNTHPYPITDKVNLLRTKKLTQDIGIVHNGIIRGYGTATGLNDTQEFISKYIYPLYKHWNGFYKNEDIVYGIEEITNSKFAILDSSDTIYYIGDFIDDGGLKFSNNTYLSFSYNYSYKYGYYNDDWYYTYKDMQEVIDKEEKEQEVLEENLYPLEPDYYIDLWGNGEIDKVGDRNYYYDFDSLELYEYINGDYKLVSVNPLIYDENYREIW